MYCVKTVKRIVEICRKERFMQSPSINGVLNTADGVTKFQVFDFDNKLLSLRNGARRKHSYTILNVNSNPYRLVRATWYSMTLTLSDLERSLQ